MEENKENDSNFKEEIIILDKPLILKNKARKLNSKLIGKKTILGRVELKPDTSHPPPQPIKKQSNAEFLLDTIVKTYWTTKWKDQITIMKYSRTGFNKKRGDFRSLCMKLNHSMKYHQYLYLIKLFDNMEKLPMKQGIKHDDFYGKIKLVKNDNNTKGKKSKIEQGDNIETDKNIYDDNGRVEIKMDIPKLIEVEIKPGQKNYNKNDNVENKIEIKPESLPKLKTIDNDNKVEK